MKSYKIVLVALFLMIFAFSARSQTIAQFNGQLNVLYVNTGQEVNVYEIRGTFSDVSNAFTADQVRAGDQIIDKSGITFEILTVTVDGITINTTAKAFNGLPPGIGLGIIYRPSARGFPLTTTNTPAAALTSASNTAILAINAAIPNYTVGDALPVSSGKVGDVIFNTSDGVLYKLTGDGWRTIPGDGIPTEFANPPSSADPGTKGDVFLSYWDSKYYVFDGSSWALAQNLSSLPVTAKYGDVFFVKGEMKLYMMGGDGKWKVISSASIPGGPGVELPTQSKPGDMFFNTDKNVLYVYDNTNTWVEVSTNGSTPSGAANPGTAKDGSLFYNTADHKLYVYNGTSWLPMDLSLRSGQIFVGNNANVASGVAVSGDATLNTAGRLLIKDHAVTEEKLDKLNIPLSGFAIPTDHISMGDGVSNFKLTNLGNPSLPSDATTKGYVDALFTNPSLMNLPAGNFFVGNATGKAAATPKNTIPLSGFDNAKANISVGDGTTNFKIVNLANPTLPQDAATKVYVDTKVLTPGNINLPKGNVLVGNDINVAIPVAKNTILLSDLGTPAAGIAMGGFGLNNLAEPVAAKDAVTKNYVDTKTISPANITLTTGNFFVGDANGKAGDVLKNTIPLSGFAPAAAAVSLGGFGLTNLAEPLTETDASTKKYVDDLFKTPATLLALPSGNFFVGNATGNAAATPKKSIPLSGFGKALDNLYMGDAVTQFNISLLADPVLPQDAATKNYVDSKTSSAGSLSLTTGHILVGDAANKAAEVAKNEVPVSDFGTAKADLVLGNGTANFKITNLADPTADQEAATKKYVDSKANKPVVGPAAPANPAAGDSYYNTTDNRSYVYNGTDWVPSDNKLIDGNLYVGNPANIAISTPKKSIPLSGFGSAQADVSLGNFKIVNVVDPENDQDAATKKYVDSKTTKTPVSPTAPATPVAGDTYYNTVDKHLYVYNGTEWIALDAKLENGQLFVGNAAGIAVSTPKNTIPLSGFDNAKANISIGDGTTNFKIVNLADPTADQEAATKKYVDSKGTKTSPTAPVNPVAGDTYYNTIDKQLYVYNGTEWIALASKLENGQLFVGNAAGIAVSTPKNTIPLSGFDNAKANISIGDGTTNFKIVNLADPTADQEAATKKYVDSKGTKTSPTAPVNPVAGDTYYNTIDKHLYVYNGTEWIALDAKLENGQLFVGNAAGIAVSTPKNTIPLSGFDFAKANISLGDGTTNFKIINLADPVNEQEAATKKYVDASLIAGKDNLGNHKATQNISLSANAISNDGLAGKGLSFDVAGNAVLGQNLTVNGNLYTPSDRRLKTHIETLTGVLQQLDQIRGVKFEYINQHKYAAGKKVGVIAQELQKVYPEMVMQGKDGFLKVDYTQLTGILIQAVKEQQKEIETLKVRMDQQQDQINSILKKIQ